jgi:hypothetical protein
MIVLSYVHVRPILAARREGLDCVSTSLDLGLAQAEVRLEMAGVLLPDGQRLAWETV